ncbi:MAG: hypothetical protein Kow0029_11650 [Candidatus Rifleibacteriota bacterium]
MQLLHAEPEKVEICLYILDIAHLDVKESEFYADFYVWYKVKPDSEWNPMNIEFMNGTIEKATEITPSDNKVNKKYWIQRIKGRFRGHFRLHSYPFDQQTLPIIIEDSEKTCQELEFVADQDVNPAALTWVDPEVVVPDWQIKGASYATDIHQYRTDFGLGTKDESRYSRFSFKLSLHRVFIPHFFKFILPLIIIAGMAYMVFFINASEFETQCGICVTALLSAVALHISQADALPAVGYLVMSDKIFILFYIVIFTALVQTVVNNHYVKKKKIEVAIKLDRIFRVGYVAVLLLGIATIYMLN